MEYLCRCGCQEMHHFGSFIVDPIETLWFVNRDHREKFKGARFGVDITKTVTTTAAAPPAYSYY